jgi:fructose-bisphosphate aldolase class II
MPLVPTAAIVDSARTRRRGAAAFNVIQVEHAQAIVAGALRADAPVILQLSENAVRYHGALRPIAAAARAVAELAETPTMPPTPNSSTRPSVSASGR